MATDSPFENAAMPHAGRLLRQWRGFRRLSQLDLALESGTSMRHLSCIETGKAQPGRALLQRLAEALDMPLRERNAMMLAAGYAPIYRESPLAAPEMAVIDQAISLILAQQEPFPGFAIDRLWNVVAANAATGRLLRAVKPGGPRHGDIVRQVFDGEDMRPCIANWSEVAGDLIAHLHHAIARNPADLALQALLREALAMAGEAPPPPRHESGAPLPVLTTIFIGPEGPLRFFSTITSFGTSWDITAEEIRIECMHPLDDATREYCARARAKDPTEPSVEGDTR